MYRNRWVFAYCNALITLAMNLITRAIWWSDKDLFSWNVPASLLVGYATGHLVWPVFERMNRSHQARLAALDLRHREVLAAIEQARIATNEKDYNEAMARVDEFLNNPASGIKISRSARKKEEDR